MRSLTASLIYNVQEKQDKQEKEEEEEVVVVFTRENRGGSAQHTQDRPVQAADRGGGGIHLITIYEEGVVFTRQNRGASVQHAIRATPTQATAR